MGRSLIMVSSVTYAMKARELLLRNGIKGFVTRIPKTEGMGCGYGVLVSKAADEAERLLRDSGFRILGRLEQEGGG